MNGPYKIGTLARLTGFSPALLRAWEKRFGLITPDRGTGHQRVYGDDDLALLRRVRTLIDEGRAIGEIAAQGRGYLLTGARQDLAPITDGARPGAAASLCQRIVAGAIALDAREVDSALDEAFATLGAPGAVAHVIEPAAVEIGELWESERCSVASEHMASSRFLQRIGRLLDSAQPVSAGAPRVIAACFPDEHHQLGLMIVAWHLARHGMRVEYLGAAMPLEDLAHVCRNSRPRALLLSVMRRPAFERHRRALARWFSDGPDRVYVGGQGVPVSLRSANKRIVFIHERPVADVVQQIVSDARLAPGRAARK